MRIRLHHLFSVLCIGAVSLFGAPKAEVVKRPPGRRVSRVYVTKAPLRPLPFPALPVTSFRPGGWLKKSLELQRSGLTGHLGEISIWLTKRNNAWLSADGKGEYGWEEVPYWLRGYSRIGYVLHDEDMIRETNVWIEGALSSQKANGDFGPVRLARNQLRDLWAQMLMLQVLQSYFEYSGDTRVLPFMTKYFRWELTIPDAQFLKDYWENSRGGDNLASVYWLYDRTGDAFLLELAAKIDRNTANWRQAGAGALPNWHVVNIAECFREPATFFLQSSKPADLEASYANFRLVREKYGQVPGGMFGADENARPGHDDPHQAAELCSMVEQIASDAMMLGYTGDPMWAENAEDVAFNTMPAALTPDYRALRYLTAPNMVMSDSRNHAPGVANRGPFFLMNPFSSRCCQHNHSSGWVNFLQGTWTATADDGVAAQLYTTGAVTAKVGEKSVGVTLSEDTRYPFDDTVRIAVQAESAVEFPLYLRVPSWTEGATVKVNGKKVEAALQAGAYLRLTQVWKTGDRVEATFPRKPRLRTWEKNKGSVSVDYGPLTFSLRIQEEYKKVETTKNAISDSRWQPEADATKWPSFEILPKSAWNYGLMAGSELKVVRRKVAPGGYPFTNDAAPLEIQASGKLIPGWGLDENGMCAVLPASPVKAEGAVERVTLVPMGGARLRISAFPVVK
jgi:hypothetical protein